MSRSIDELVSVILDVGELPHGLTARDLLNPDVVPPDAYAAKVFALRDLVRTGGRETTFSGVVSSSDEVARFFVPHLASETSEAMWLIGLDIKKRVRFSRRIARGSTSWLVVTPGELVRPLVINAIPYAIIVHNHAWGDPAPTEGDIAFTVGVAAVFDLLGHKLLDHVVVGNGSHASMHDMGIGPWAAP